jgi:hypothetical protein
MGQKGEKLIYTSLNYLIFFLELKKPDILRLTTKKNPQSYSN